MVDSSNIISLDLAEKFSFPMYITFLFVFKEV